MLPVHAHIKMLKIDSHDSGYLDVGIPGGSSRRGCMEPISSAKVCQISCDTFCQPETYLSLQSRYVETEVSTDIISLSASICTRLND